MDEPLKKLKATESSNTGGRPYLGAVRKTPQPSDAAKPIVWAVWLGANTAARLAHQWGIDKSAAERQLREAVRMHRLRRLPHGRFAVSCYRPRLNGRFTPGAAVCDGVPWAEMVSV